MSASDLHEHAHPRRDDPGTRNRRELRRRRLAALTAAAMLVGGLSTIGTAAQAETLPVGEGSYTTDQVGPTPEGCAPLATDARAYLTDTAPAGAVPTNDWWSSLVFKKYNCVGSEPLHAHPVSYLPQAGGLGCRAPASRSSPVRPAGSASSTTRTRRTSSSVWRG